MILIVNMKIKCKYCGAVFEAKEGDIDKKSEYMQCPFCASHSINPLKENETHNEEVVERRKNNG